MAKIPGLAKLKWYDREWLVELLSGSPAAASLVWASVDSFQKAEPAKGITFAITCLILIGACALKVVRGTARDNARAKRESPMDLLGCAQVLQKSLALKLGASDGQIRLTIHRVVQSANASKDTFEQVIPYVGGPGGGASRTWSTSVGIVGRVIREGDPLWALRNGSDRSGFVRELIRDWGYSQSEARALSDDRIGWIAVPVFDNFEKRKVIAVVYVDSSKPTDISEETCKYTAELSEAVATFIGMRYN